MLSAATRRFQSPHRRAAPSPACSEHLAPRLDGVMPEQPPQSEKWAVLRPSPHWFDAGKPFMWADHITIARCYACMAEHDLAEAAAKGE